MAASSLTSSPTLLAPLIVAIMMYSGSARAELERFEHSRKPDGSLSFLVVGDRGRRGLYNQTEVALQMGVIGEIMDIDFVASTGDNFYDNGLTGVDDPAFDESFSKIYTAPSWRKQWYNVLGNHDYRSDVEAQLNPILRALDSRWLCSRSFIVNAEIVDILFVDTNPFVDEYFTKPGGYKYDWRGVLPREKYLSNLLKDVDSALKESRAKWKIVVGHHTIRSAGFHGNTDELVKQLLPILEVIPPPLKDRHDKISKSLTTAFGENLMTFYFRENNVDLYINGHDHCLEHISSADSGGGSKAWRGEIRWPTNPEEVKFYYDEQGFMSMKITPAEVDVAFYDVFGTVLYTWSRTKEIFSIV